MMKPAVHRTQLHLDEDRYRYLVLKAKTLGKSLAQVVRDLIDTDRSKRSATWKKDSIWKMVGAFKGDGSAVAEHVDDYLYGDKR